MKFLPKALAILTTLFACAAHASPIGIGETDHFMYHMDTSTLTKETDRWTLQIVAQPKKNGYTQSATFSFTFADCRLLGGTLLVFKEGDWVKFSDATIGGTELGDVIAMNICIVGAIKLKKQQTSNEDVTLEDILQEIKQ